MLVKKRMVPFLMAVVMAFQWVLSTDPVISWAAGKKQEEKAAETKQDESGAEAQQDANVVGRISIYSEYSEKTNWDAVLHNEKLILMAPEDIGEIAGNLEVSYNSDHTVCTISRGSYHVKVDLNKEKPRARVWVTICWVEGKEAIVEPYGGTFPLEYVTEMELSGKKQVVLPLEQMLYLLNVQWICGEGTVYTVTPKETLWNVAGSAVQSIQMGDLPRKEDIFGKGIKGVANVMDYAVMSFADEVTVLSLLPGNDKRFLKGKMEEALLRLSVPCTAYMEKESIEMSDLIEGTLSNPLNMLKSASTVTSGVTSGLDLMQKFYSWLEPMVVDVDVDMSWDVNTPGFLNFADPALTAIAKSVDIVMTASRYKSWDEEYVEQLKYLSEFEDKANKEMNKRVKDIAGKLYKEKSDSSHNLVREYIKAAGDVIGDTAAGLTVTGKVVALYNAMINVVDVTTPAFAYSLDLGDAAALADSLTDVSLLMRNQYIREVKEVGEGELTISKIKDIRHAGLLTMNAAAHVWTILREPLLSENSSRVTVGWELDRCFGIATRFSESVQYDQLLLLYRNYRNIHEAVPGAMRCVIPPEYVRCGVPVIWSSHIVEYNGITYSISVRTDKRSLEDMGMVSLKIPSAAEGRYICSFTIYKNKVYYICKEPGTSDYRSALYSCRLDGSEQTLLKEMGMNGSGDFYIKNERIYPNIYSDPSAYMDLITGQWGNDNQYQKPDTKVRYHSRYMFTSGKDGIIQTEYETDVNGSLEFGESRCAVPAEYGQSYNKKRIYAAIEAVTEKYVYYTFDLDADGYLCRYNIDTGEIEELDFHMMVGGGTYFNW